MAETISKNARLRSPAYPYLDLEAAIEKTEMFYNNETTQRVSASVATADLGYEEGSSRGWRALASLLSFGLLEEEGSKENREVWLSELGKEIFHYGNRESEEARRAIRIAALKPPIHLELWELWGNEGQLPSDAQMRRYLVQTKSFNPKAVDDFLKEFVNTLTYAGFIRGGKIVSTDAQEKNTKTTSEPTRARVSTGKTMTTTAIADNLEEITIPLVGGTTAILAIPRPLSKRNFDKIKNWLALMEDALIEDENSNVTTDRDNATE